MTLATIEKAKRRAVADAAPRGREKPRKTKGLDVRLDPEQSYRSAMSDLIGQRWGEVWRAVPAALAGEDIEGVHDVRVASRRLRAAMDVAADCFPASWFRPLHAVAKEITGALGEVRDRDVLLEALARELAVSPAPERPGIERLVRRVEEERVVARFEMERFLARLGERGIPRDAERRFGPLAAPPEPAQSGMLATGDDAGETGR